MNNKYLYIGLAVAVAVVGAVLVVGRSGSGGLLGGEFRGGEYTGPNPIYF